MDGQNGFLARQDASWTCLFDRHPNQLKAGAFVAVTGGLFSDALAELFRKICSGSPISSSWLRDPDQANVGQAVLFLRPAEIRTELFR
ncbi:hypothetical protein NKJ09_31690 [Mesorhizobium sp. M0189]|uniref:hypothetical protein n=1 Tax=unclassified Mesorhizobium TaxID=325217 RepID=UPI00333DBA61